MNGFLSGPATPTIYVLHENDEWVAPLRDALHQLRAPFCEWHLDEAILDLTAPPPPGIYYNRMSASSHTRGHRFAPELTSATLAWLAAHGRKIINGPRALALEVSKVEQYEALKRCGIAVPETLAVVGRGNIAKAAKQRGFPLILKHNRAGKGLGVVLLRSMSELHAHLGSDAFEVSIDGITLVQRYISAPQPFITRVEFVGGKFMYAVRVDTSDGFELCPADACTIDQRATTQAEDLREKFSIIEDFTHPWIQKWESFLDDNDIQVAGIEFIVDAEGRSFTYDVNTNTNYNPDAEKRSSRKGMTEIAKFLQKGLEAEYPAVRAGVAA